MLPSDEPKSSFEWPEAGGVIRMVDLAQAGVRASPAMTRHNGRLLTLGPDRLPRDGGAKSETNGQDRRGNHRADRP